MNYAPQQGSYFALRITLEGVGDDALAQSLSTARVDMNPHQVDAALFALSSPFSKGALLADEVGLGKTIEASLVKAAVTPLSETRRHVFGGFVKCCYPLQRFESDPERRFAVVIDGEATVDKWLKPGKGQFQIDYRSGESYEPDFVVEARDAVFICEVKSAAELSDPVVQAKASAARKWCKAATVHTGTNGGKSWSYALISDTDVLANATLAGLIERSEFR